VRRGAIRRRVDPVFHSTPDYGVLLVALYKQTHAISDFAEFIDSGRPLTARLSENGIPAYEVGHIEQGKFKPTDILVNPNSDRILKRHDILTGRVGGLGCFAEYKKNTPASFSDNTLRIRPKTSQKSRAAFIEAFLNSTIGNTQLLRDSRGGLQKVVTQKSLGSVIVPSIGASESRLVAELDAARAERARALAEAERLPLQLEADIYRLLGIVIPPPDERKVYGIRLSSTRNSRLDAGYHHPRYIEAIRVLQAGNGQKIVLGDILRDIAGGATPRAKDKSLYTNSGVKFLRILNVKPNRLDFSDLNYIHEFVHEGMLKRSKLASNDVLMTITGRVGTAAVVSDDDLPANINQHIVRLRITTQRCLPKYLAAYLNTSLGGLLSNRSVSGGTRVALDYGAIRQIPLLLPKLDIQHKVVELVDTEINEEARLRTHAEAVWREARERFEQQLLQGNKS
jgi:restriction endonuclease S subunit